MKWKGAGNSIRIIIVLATLLVNTLLIYLLLYDPFSQVLVDKTQPYQIREANSVIEVTTFAVIGLLLVTSSLLLAKIYKRQKVFAAAPLFTCMVIAALFVVSSTSLSYPSSTFGYEKDGYYYKIEIWWNTPNHINTYKRWKSVQPYDGKTNTDGMRYLPDSVSNTAGK